MRVTRDIENKQVVIHPKRGKKIVILLNKFSNIIRGSWTCKPSSEFVKLWGRPEGVHEELYELGFRFRQVAGAWIIFFNPKYLSARQLTDEVRGVIKERLSSSTVLAARDAGEDGLFWFIMGYLHEKYSDYTPGEVHEAANVVYGYIEPQIPDILNEYFEAATCS